MRFSEWAVGVFAAAGGKVLTRVLAWALVGSVFSFPGTSLATVSDLDVTKTAYTSFDRTYYWAINKTATIDAIPVSEFNLAIGQSVEVQYTITATPTPVDSNWKVYGDITLTNYADVDLEIVAIYDTVYVNYGDINATTDTSYPFYVYSDDFEIISYYAELSGAFDGYNNVSADYTDPVDLNNTIETEGFDIDFFFYDPDNEYFSNIYVFDEYLSTYIEFGINNTSYSYSRTIGSYGTPGVYTVSNTASFYENEENSGSSTWDIRVNVAAPAPVPEPSTFVLFGAGLAGLVAWRRKKRA